MILFIWRKNNASFLRYLDFCGFFLYPQVSKSLTSSLALLPNGSYTYTYFFWILSTIYMKFGQILVCCMTNISNMFLAQNWRLKTSSSHFHDFIKLTIKRDLTILNSGHVQILIVSYSPLFQIKKKQKKKKHWNVNTTGYWLIEAGC